MIDRGLFNQASRVLVDCLKLCFIGVLRKELKEMAGEWNEHIITRVATVSRLVELIQCISCLISLIVNITQIH